MANDQKARAEACRAAMESNGCGVMYSGLRHLCDHPYLPDDIRSKECSCRVDAEAAITAYLAASTPLQELTARQTPTDPDIVAAQSRNRASLYTSIAASTPAKPVGELVDDLQNSIEEERAVKNTIIQELKAANSALLEDCESYKASDAENFRKYTAAQAQVAILTAALEKLVAAEDQYVAEAGMDLADPIADAVAAARATLNHKAPS